MSLRAQRPAGPSGLSFSRAPLRARAPSAARKLDRVLAAGRGTSCVFSEALGTESPCGMVLACCDAAGRFTTICIFTSKPADVLNLSGYESVQPSALSDMETAVLKSMRDNLKGPFYHNVFVAPGTPLHGGPEWTLAERAALGQIHVMDATPLIGPLLDDKLRSAMQPVIATAQTFFDSEGLQVAAVPFRQIPGEDFEGALARLRALL